MSLAALGAPSAALQMLKVEKQRGKEQGAAAGVRYSCSHGGTGTWGSGRDTFLQLFTIIGIFSAEQTIFGGYRSRDLSVLLIKHSRIHFRVELLSLLPLTQELKGQPPGQDTRV